MIRMTNEETGCSVTLETNGGAGPHIVTLRDDEAGQIVFKTTYPAGPGMARIAEELACDSIRNTIPAGTSMIVS